MRVKVNINGEIQEMLELHDRLEVVCGHYGVSLRDFIYMYYFHVHGPSRFTDNIIEDEKKGVNKYER